MTPDSGPRPSLTWIEGTEALAPWLDDWQALTDRLGSDILLSPGLLQAWWPVRGHGRRLVCLAARDQGRLVGLLPFMIDRIWFGPLPLRIARLAATDPHCIPLSLPVEPAYLAALLREASLGLLGQHGCAAVSLTPVSEAASFAAPLLALAQDPLLHLADHSEGTHSLFRLEDSFEAYLSSHVSNKRRGQFRRDLKGLQDAFQIREQQSVPDAGALMAFALNHAEQWRDQGKGGHFADWRDALASYLALVPTSRTDWGLRLFSVIGQTGTLAEQLCLVSGNTCHWRLPSRSLDPQAEKLSIGKVGLLMMIRDLIDSGVRVVEGGRGVYDYKTALGGQNIPIHRVILCRNSSSRRLMLRLLLRWADIVDLVYYRLWFKKIAPIVRRRLGMKPAPLWTTWIRSRL